MYTPSRKKSFKQPIGSRPSHPKSLGHSAQISILSPGCYGSLAPSGGITKYISPRQGGNRPTIFNKKFAYFFHIHVEGDMDLMYIYIYVVRERCYLIYCMCSRCWMICRFPKSNISKLCCQAKDGNLQWLQGGAPFRAQCIGVMTSVSYAFLRAIYRRPMSLQVLTGFPGPTLYETQNYRFFFSHVSFPRI